MYQVQTKGSFQGIKMCLRQQLREAPPVKTERWQGVPTNTDTFEVLNVCFEVDLEGIEDLDYWRKDIKPNLPWADDHFQERVCGEPLNPGEQWKHWPYAQSATKFVTQRFNHTYMERLWPKFPRRTEEGHLASSYPNSPRRYPDYDRRPKYGIAHHYGDLWDWVELIAQEPHTRQGYIPLFFPEDTGVGDGGRKPCTLGYQCMVRDNRLHMWYPLRSCDFRRHWPDDVYLALRLQLWLLDKCRVLNSAWNDIVPGTFAMHMTSLHIFANDKKWLEDKGHVN